MKALKRAVVTCGWLLCIGAVSAWAFSNQPKGFGKADLGMSSKQVAALYPEMKPVPAEQVDPIYRLPEISVSSVGEQKVDGLSQPVVVHLRFLKDRLWSVLLLLGNNDPDVVTEVFTKRYGDPQLKLPRPMWRSPEVTVSLDARQHRAEIVSAPLAAEAQKLVLGELKGPEHEHGHAPAALGPLVPAPAAPAPVQP